MQFEAVSHPVHVLLQGAVPIESIPRAEVHERESVFSQISTELFKNPSPQKLSVQSFLQLSVLIMLPSSHSSPGSVMPLPHPPGTQSCSSVLHAYPSAHMNRHCVSLGSVLYSVILSSAGDHIIPVHVWVKLGTEFHSEFKGFPGHVFIRVQRFAVIQPVHERLQLTVPVEAVPSAIVQLVLSPGSQISPPQRYPSPQKLADFVVQLDVHIEQLPLSVPRSHCSGSSTLPFPHFIHDVPFQ